jgi:hypothetical protein
MTTTRLDSLAREDSQANFNFQISLYASLVVCLVALSFQSYFLFVPFANGVNFLAVMAFLTQIGWLLLVAVPPLLLSKKSANWTGGRVALFIFASTLWTVSTLIIKIYGLVTAGQLWASYLVAYPIMIFVEWILPIFYVVLAVRLARSNRPSL